MDNQTNHHHQGHQAAGAHGHGHGHGLMHVLGCALPIIAIFVLPIFGVSEGMLLFVFIVLMFACHIMMLGHHGNH